MINFVLTRMWMYHGKLNESHFHKFVDTLDVKGQTILETPISFANDKTIQGKIIARWRDFSEKAEEGHDLYPCIDLLPDEITLKTLENYFLEKVVNCKLTDCRFRITDYGYLNVVLVFAVENIEGLEQISNQQVKITRKINEWIPTLDTVLDDLQKHNYVNISDDYFGIPLKIKDYLSIDSSDMYTYQDITIITDSNRKQIHDIRKMYGINDEAEKVENFEIHGIDQSPIICTENEMTLPEIYDLIEPYNLLLAEINTYDSVCNLHYALIKLMNVTDMSKNKNRKRFGKNKIESAFDSFTSSDLRKSTINTHYILHCINFRKTAILPWQNLLLRKFKEKNPYDENRNNYERSEIIIEKLINEKTQQSQKGHSHTLEILFMFLSAITIYSTYVDIVSFLDSSHSNFSSLSINTLEIKIFLCITFILAVVFLYIIRAKRKE